MWWLDLFAAILLLFGLAAAAEYAEKNETTSAVVGCLVVLFACGLFYCDAAARTNAWGCVGFDNNLAGLDYNTPYQTLDQFKAKDGSYAFVRIVDGKSETNVRCTFAPQEFPPLFSVGSDKKIFELSVPLKNK